MNGRAACRIWEMNSGRNRGEFMDNVRIIRLAWRQWWCATDVRPLFGDQWPLCWYGRAVRANWACTPSLAYSGRVSARKMPLSGPKKTARPPFREGAEAAFGYRSGRFSASVFSCRVWPDRYTKTLYLPRIACERLAIRGLAGAPCAFRNPGGHQGAMCRTTGQLASILPARAWLKWSTLIH